MRNCLFRFIPTPSLKINAKTTTITLQLCDGDIESLSFPGLPRLYTAQSMNTRVCVACRNIERIACQTQATLGARTGWETGKSWSHPAPLTSLIDQWADSDVAILITGSYAEEVTLPSCDSATNTVDFILKPTKLFAKGHAS